MFFLEKNRLLYLLSTLRPADFRDLRKQFFYVVWLNCKYNIFTGLPCLVPSGQINHILQSQCNWVPGLCARYGVPRLQFTRHARDNQKTIIHSWRCVFRPLPPHITFLCIHSATRVFAHMKYKRGPSVFKKANPPAAWRYSRTVSLVVVAKAHVIE